MTLSQHTPTETQHLVLLGAGHAHIQVLQGLAHSRPDKLRITVIAPVARQLYSGMVPGFVAGHYELDDCVIPLAGLLADCQAHFIKDIAVAIDANAQTVTLASGDVVTWDLLSVNTGPVMDRDKINAQMPGAPRHALFIRPIEAFGQHWPQVEALGRRRPIHVAVVGAGAAGLELAMAVAHRLQGNNFQQGGCVSLVTGGSAPAQSYSAGVQRRVTQALKRLNINVVPDACVGMAAGEIWLGGGGRLACDVPLLAVGAQAPQWVAGSGLALDMAGFVGVNHFQQSTSHPHVFAAGDVATRMDGFHPRSGVYAVRAGPPLLANLTATLRGRPLQPYQPASRTLNLISCGKQYAIAAWGPWHVEGRWVWHVKDRIDRGFVRRYAAA